MARSVTEMRRLDLPIEQLLEASLPDVNTDPSRATPDLRGLSGLPSFEIDGVIDGPEFQADLIQSCSGLSR